MHLPHRPSDNKILIKSNNFNFTINQVNIRVFANSLSNNEITPVCSVNSISPSCLFTEINYEIPYIIHSHNELWIIISERIMRIIKLSKKAPGMRVGKDVEKYFCTTIVKKK